jgi:AbiV family abortive infection protein
MDLAAVRSAPVPVLADAAAAAAGNASNLADAAEILADADHPARACSLAALGSEEAGKALYLTALAALPEKYRAQAPLRRMLRWHALKSVTADLVAVIEAGPPHVARRLLETPEQDLEQVLFEVRDNAEASDRLKASGLYVDIGPGGGIFEPGEVIDAAASSQLDLAQLAAKSVMPLTEPAHLQAIVANPPDEGLELMLSAMKAISAAGPARTPDAAAHVVAEAVYGLVEPPESKGARTIA